jgi:hypothetical protein
MLTRTQLREIVVEKLKGETAAKERVYDSKLIASEDDVVMISVFTTSELSQDGWLFVTLEIAAAVMANVGENAAVLLDSLCGEIRIALRRFWEEYGQFTASYQGTDIIFDVEAAQPFAAAQISYQVQILIEE